MKTENIYETILLNNGFWAFGAHNELYSFEYEEGEAIPIWTSRKAAEKSEEAGFEYDIAGVNIYEFVYWMLPAEIEWDDELIFLLYPAEGEPVLIEGEMLRKELTDALISRKEKGTAGYRFDDDSLHDQKPFNEKEILNVSRAAPDSRYRHLVTNLAMYRSLWWLAKDDEIATINSENGKSTLLIWPAKEWAEMNAKGLFENYVAEQVNLFEFMYEILPSFEEGFDCTGEGLLACAMIENDNVDGLALNTEVFMEDILEELSRY